MVLLFYSVLFYWKCTTVTHPVMCVGWVAVFYCAGLAFNKRSPVSCGVRGTDCLSVNLGSSLVLPVLLATICKNHINGMFNDYIFYN